jgi:hypothetical protein
MTRCRIVGHGRLGQRARITHRGSARERIRLASAFLLEQFSSTKPNASFIDDKANHDDERKGGVYSTIKSTVSAFPLWPHTLSDRSLGFSRWGATTFS